MKIGIGDREMEMKTMSNEIYGHLTRLKTGDWCLAIPKRYDRALAFCRVNEFNNPGSGPFYGVYFTLYEYMEWYADQNSGVFGYPLKHEEFSVPFTIVDLWCRLLLKREGDRSLSRQERLLIDAWDEISGIVGSQKNFNLICRAEA